MNGTQKRKIANWCIIQLKNAIGFKLKKGSNDFDSIMQSVITRLNQEYRENQ